MTVAEIFQRLAETCRVLPVEAIESARANRDLVRPELIRVLRQAVEGPDALTDDQLNSPVTGLALLLLAEFRDPEGYELSIALFRLPERQLDSLLGDTLTQAGGRALASMFNGNINPLIDLLFDESAYEFARSEAITAFQVLGCTGKISLAEISRHFGEWIKARRFGENDFLWETLIGSCVDLRLTEHLPEIRELYAAGLAFGSIISEEEVEEALAGKTDLNGENVESRLVTDALEEIFWWRSFNAEEGDDSDRNEEDFEEADFIDDSVTRIIEAPAYNPKPKIPRNAPCPCGSGKKYKKCCGA